MKQLDEVKALDLKLSNEEKKEKEEESGLREEAWCLL